MKKTDAVVALAALAQDNRLDVFRLLVQAGPEGMPAGSVAEALGLAPKLVRCGMENFKITWPQDFDLAERLLRTR